MNLIAPALLTLFAITAAIEDLVDLNVSKCAPNIENREHSNQATSMHHTTQLKYVKALIESGSCRHFYLDLGTNIGVTIRKLYEPQYYKDAPMVEFFQSLFGDVEERHKVCSIGFEPNTVWVEHLENLQTVYRKAGFPTVIFTNSALASTRGILKFFRIVGYNEVGSSVVDLHGQDDDYVEAIAVDTDALIKHVMEMWKASPSYQKGVSKVFAKMDIEGSEYFVLPKMLQGGSLCDIDVMTMEWHPGILDKCTSPLSTTEAMKAVQWITSGLCPNFRLVNLDDETYALQDPGPMPIEFTDTISKIIEVVDHG